MDGNPFDQFDIEQPPVSTVTIPPALFLWVLSNEFEIWLGVDEGWIAWHADELQRIGFPAPKSQEPEQYCAVEVVDWVRLMRYLHRPLPPARLPRFLCGD